MLFLPKTWCLIKLDLVCQKHDLPNFWDRLCLTRNRCYLVNLQNLLVASCFLEDSPFYFYYLSRWELRKKVPAHWIRACLEESQLPSSLQPGHSRYQLELAVFYTKTRRLAVLLSGWGDRGWLWCCHGWGWRGFDSCNCCCQWWR